jgi:peptide/nickel transport system substrate-binding protein
MFLWGWVGDAGDPNTLLQPFLTSSIGSQSDSQWSNARYDELYTQQNEAATADARKAPLAEMQNLVYDEAPYQILTNGSELHVYRTDKFADWQVMPTGTGTPFFVMGNLNYTALTDASAVPSPSPSPSAGESPSASASAAPSATAAPGGTSGTGSGDTALLVVGVVVLVALIVVGLVLWRRTRAGGPGAEEE